MAAVTGGMFSRSGGMFSRSGNGLNAGLFKKTQSDQWNHFPTWGVEHPVVDHSTVQVIKTTWQQLKSGECQIFKKTGYRAFGNQGSTRHNTRGNTQKTHTVRTSTIHNHHVRGETKSLQTKGLGATRALGFLLLSVLKAFD
eukprot:g28381.t1